MTAGYSDEPFVGYIFRSAPPRPQPRLWFLDRHIEMLMRSGWTISNGPLSDIDVGSWSLELVKSALSDGSTWRVHADSAVGHILRYQHHGEEPWTAAWRITDTTIPDDPALACAGFGIHTFGRDDDVWRLGLWPD